MNYVGFQHNYSTGTNPHQRFSPSLINRVVLMDAQLRRSGCRLFLHSPRDIRPGRSGVPGSLFEDGAFIPTRTPMPRVNGNWTHRTRRLLEKGMGYQEFGLWAEEHAVKMYVPYAFSELLGNKLETYKLVRAFRSTLHPHCEPYARTVSQLQYFVALGCLTFIKPSNGSRGNRIITLRRDDSGLQITRYFKGERRSVQVANLRDAMTCIGDAIRGEGAYVIQHGVETMRHQGSTFDIRVTMVHDGTCWHWLHEARRSATDSDVSNVSQGGTITPTEELLFDLVGAERSRELLHEIEGESFGLAAYLERLHPGAIPEVAFDFVVDQEGGLRLLEINTKPGLAGVGSEISIYDKRPEHEALFERWVYPHTRYLASFLLSKVEAGRPDCFSHQLSAISRQ